MLPQLDEKIQAAAEAFEQAVLEMHHDDKGVHVNTLLSTTAAIVAEAIMRARLPEVQIYGDRGIIIAPEADALLLGEPDGCVMDFIYFTAQEAGLTPETVPDIDDIFRHTAQALGKSEIPALTVPDDQRPQFWSMAGATYARPRVLELYQQYGLSADEAVLASTLVLCRLLNGTQKVMEPRVAFRLVMETLVGALRLHPVSREDLERVSKQ